MLAKALELSPAAALALFVMVAIFGLQLHPFGKGLFLVRAHDRTPRSALMAAADARGALVGIPAPGFAIIYGEAAKIRAALGLTVLWKGNAGCTPTP